MPLPTPNKRESEKDFIDRCMGDSTMTREYPDSSQRRAICQKQWDSKAQAEAEKTAAAGADPFIRDRAIMRYLTQTGWAIMPEVLERLVGIVERHAEGVNLDAEQIEAALGAARKAPPPAAYPRIADYRVDRITATAIVPVVGVIAKHASQVNDVSQPEGTSTEQIRDDLARAMADEKVNSVMLHIESPGGTVFGTPELAAEIAELAKTKPIIAYADDLAASGAYWLGSQASRFYASRTAAVGSIGVYFVIRDSSRRAEREGVRYHVVRTGRYKGVGLPGTSVEQSDLGDLEGQARALHQVFAADVARGRHLADEAISQVADGRVLIGGDAVAAGLIDAVMSFQQALTSARPVAKAARRSTSKPKATQKGKAMADEAQETQTGLTAEDVGTAAAAAAEKAKAEATAAERDRIAALQAEFGDQPEVLAKATADGLTIDQAKAAAYDALKASLAASRKEADDLKAAIGREGMSIEKLLKLDASDEQADPKAAGGSAADDGEAATYTAAVERFKAELMTSGVAEASAGAKAHARATREYPKAKAAWMKANKVG